MKIKVKGIDQMEKQLRQMERGAKELSGSHQVPLSELFPPAFMRKYTPYSSMDELLKAGGFHVESQEDFKAIPDAEFDAHIASKSCFSSWEEMLKAATKQYAMKKLGF